MVGKAPHRPEGKAKDAENMAAARSRDAPHQAPSQKEIDALNARKMRQAGGPARLPAQEEIGGSRPGVEGRVRPRLGESEDTEK